jgi:FkbM family methyltransferase
MSSFCLAYSKLISAAVAADCADNYDHDRFGPPPRNAFDAKALLKRILGKIGLVSVDRVSGDLRAGLSFIEPHSAQLEWLYAQLGDQESRDLLVSLMAFRALGHRKVKLPTNTPEYWQGIERAKKLSLDEDDLDLGFRGFRAVRMNLRELGYPITLYFVPFAVHIQFVMQPYRCGGSDKPIEATAGDVVLDCGGCYGDTALYFAHKVGQQGKVLSFEFVPANLEILRKNVDLNPSLKPTIRLVEAPVSDKSGHELFLEGSGPGTRIVPKPSSVGAASVRTVAIDDVVERENLERVDFVKMDIEGSELAALQGAEKTLRKFRPTLAVSVYHNLSDFWTIPQYLDSLGLGYRFYLRHFTIHAEETVLFAVADEREQPVSEASLRAS